MITKNLWKVRKDIEKEASVSPNQSKMSQEHSSGHTQSEPIMCGSSSSCTVAEKWIIGGDTHDHTAIL